MQFKRFKAKDVVPAGGASQFKWPVAPCQGVPPADGADKARQFKAPRTPSFDLQHTDKVEQAERYALPGAGGAAGRGGPDPVVGPAGLAPGRARGARL